MELTSQDTQQIAQYIEESSALIDKLAADLKNAQAQKQAGEKPVLQKAAVEQTVDALVNAGFDKKANRDQLVAQIMGDPSKALGLLTKIAGLPKKAGTVPVMGKVASEQEKAAVKRARSDEFFEERFPVGG